MNVQPCADSRSKGLVQRYLPARKNDDQHLDRLERLSRANQAVESVSLIDAEVRPRNPSKSPSHGSAVNSRAAARIRVPHQLRVT